MRLSGSTRAQQTKGKPPEFQKVEGAMHRSGELQPDDVLKFSMPRKDLNVAVAGNQVKAGLALAPGPLSKK